ncbi:MAG TPA: LamG domain-containing protein, partial [Bacteroidia bacterium]|nr:LamG domain-containing protein [Bacteroidia bacterium]
MKKHFTRLLTLCGVLSCGAAFAQLTPEVLYYDFNGSGTNVPNLASAPPPGTTIATIQGAVTQGGSGTLCGGALIGSGNASTTDYLNTGWTPSLGGGSWTISFRTSGISTNATLYYIFGDANTNSFRCFTNGIAGSTNWVLRGAGLTDAYINGGALSTATMCTYVYDQGANQIYGYLNGVLVSTTAQVAPNVTGTGPFKVMGYATNVGAPAGGLMDEFRLYSRALSGTEVAQLYNPFATAGFLGSDITFCNGDSTQLNLGWPYTTATWSTGSTTGSTWVSTAGAVTVSLSGACGTGMDTVLAFDGTTIASISPMSCSGTYVAPSGAVYSASGIYMDTIPNAVGCDSVITINATIGNNTTASLNTVSCGLYTAPSGATYSISGTYMDTIPNMSGCDSVLTINLFVAGATSSTFSAA